MTKIISGADVSDAFYEDDGSALWFELANKEGERVRIEVTAVQFNAMMQKFADITYQVQEAQNEAIDTHAMTALHSFSESVQAAVGGSHVVVRFQVSKDGLEQAFAMPVERAFDLSARIDEAAQRASESASENRH